MMTGWFKENGDWYYLKSKKQNGREIAGHMAKHWLEIEGTWYYFHSDGKMAKSVWRQDEAKKHWYYLRSNGKMRADERNQSIREVVTAKNQYSGFRNSEIGNPQNEDVKQAAIDALSGSVSNPIGKATFFFGRVNNYDIWYESTNAIISRR